ncbi:MAG: PKD domain-containing protein [Phycisphaerae bacterium]|nr:PKD domain-containing protein [Phycisphaerae bacterium]
MLRTDPCFRLGAFWLVALAGGTGLADQQPGNPLGLIPTPQQCQTIDATFELKEKTPIILPARASARDELTARLLQHRIHETTGLMLPIVRGTSGRGIQMLQSSTPEGMAALSHHGRHMPFHVGDSARGWDQEYQYQQEYFLHVGAAGAVIVANTSLGLFNGAMTLAQLVTPDELVLACTVSDWPEMRFRGLHLRMDCPAGSETVRPTCGQLKYVVETMARLKLNYLLLETASGVETPSVPGLARLEALTVAQQRELREFAEALNVQIVPVLDSWSDVGHWRAHPVTRELAPAGRIDLNRMEAVDVLTRIAADLNRNLNSSEFFHVGGRGTFEKPNAYAQFHARLIRQVTKATGKRPMTWAMATTTPAAILYTWPKEVVLIPDHPTNPRGGWYRDGVSVADVWSSGMGLGRSQIALATPCAGSRSDHSWPFAHWTRVERHLSLWAEAVHQLGKDDASLGMVSTLHSWHGVGTVEAALPQVGWLAELSWNDARAGSLPDDRFDRAVGWHLCGVATEGERVLRVCRSLGDMIGTTPEARSLDRSRLMQAVRYLGGIHFGPGNRPIGHALCRAAATMVEVSGRTLASGQLTTPQAQSLTGQPVAGASAPASLLGILPTAASDGAKTGWVGQQVTFDGSASRDATGGRSIEAWWEFGDGTRSEGLRAQHVYARPGMYVASLTVSDSTGTRRREPLLVTIAAKPESAVMAVGQTEEKATGTAGGGL